jgi:ABC-2 type transport system permease protein
VLYTGYWFWGNFLNPRAIPTLSGTLLTPGGEFAAGAFFGVGRTRMNPAHTVTEAVLNLVVLAACAALALLALERHLAHHEAR